MSEKISLDSSVILIFIKELYISIFNLYICCILQCLRDNTYTVLNFI